MADLSSLDLRRLGAPTGALDAFAAIETGFVWAGHAAPAAWRSPRAWADVPLLAALAGALAAAAGAWFKYTLVCRASFTQGFALPHTPARGRGKAQRRRKAWLEPHVDPCNRSDRSRKGQGRKRRCTKSAYMDAEGKAP